MTFFDWYIIGFFVALVLMTVLLAYKNTHENESDFSLFDVLFFSTLSFITVTIFFTAVIYYYVVDKYIKKD
jgi:hypothetical protein